MGVGHVAVALGASRAIPRVNVGWLVFAAFLSDFLLGIFAVVGVEHASVPDSYATKHYLLFTFPYSHGLAALVAWAAIFGFLISRGYAADARRIWLVVALVVLSHYLLDGLVHVAGLPLLGQDSPKLGLGLWNDMPLELSLETLMAAAGIALYWKLRGSKGSTLARYGMAVFLGVVVAMTWTQLGITTPPTLRQLSISWIVVPVVFAAMAYGLDWKRTRLAAGTGLNGFSRTQLASKA
jgi:hypothetical protein